jgi:uncharacterized phage protein (TIGR02220 family)
MQLFAVEDLPAPEPEPEEVAERVIKFLNERTGKHYKAEGKAGTYNRKFVVDRIVIDGATERELRMLVAYLVRDWTGKTFQNGKPGVFYLRPETIFNQSVYHRYIGEIG